MRDIGTRLIPLTKWADHHPWPSAAGLRHLVFHEQTNGFSKVIRRIGRRILIHEGAFFKWVEEKNGSAKSMVNDHEKPT